VVQRYLNPILQAALSQHLQIQAAAIDVLNFTIKQGLAHPLQVWVRIFLEFCSTHFSTQSFPVIVALETSPNPTLSARASSLHAILHSKHTSLLNTRYIFSAKASFDYQRKLISGTVQGLPESSLTWRQTELLFRLSNATCSNCFTPALVFTCFGKKVLKTGFPEVTSQGF